MIRRLILSVLIVAALLADASAQNAIRLEERLRVDSSYHVSCRVSITGKMTLPDKVLNIDGKSEIEYDERVLRLTPQGEVDRTVRLVDTMDFNRKIGDESQRSQIRPAVRRMVILRQDNLEVPFSPDGPLRREEIDLVRTDVFTPALSGMLPKNPVRVGDGWKATEEAVRELTDLLKITQGGLGCKLLKIDETTPGRPHAKIEFEGTVDGFGETGAAKHELKGFFYFDINAARLTYVSLQGTANLLDAKGLPQSTMSGTFTLTREPRAAPPLIAAGAPGLVVEPSEDNTRLLFDDEESGLSFVHSRRWRTRIEAPQIKVDDHKGNGFVLTLEPPARMPTIEQFQKEAQGLIVQRKGVILKKSEVKALQFQPYRIDSFTIEADIPTDKEVQRTTMFHAVLVAPKGGITVAATLTAGDRFAIQTEIERIIQGLRLK